MRFIIMVGPAGAGKSTLTAELASHIESYGLSVAKVNFDPAVENIPYAPDLDVRDYITAYHFMEKGLGPNGALIAAVDSLINYITDLRERLDEINSDYVIIDTPGQLELFAYRPGGPIIIDALTGEFPVVTVFLMDALFFENIPSIVSILTLASSVAVRLGRPQINVVSKADLLLQEVLDEVVPRLGEEGFLESLLQKEDKLDSYTLSLSLKPSEALYESGFIGEIIPVSIRDPETLDSLYAKIQQITVGGDDYGLYDVVDI